jgi:hypothetical protein
MTRQPVCRRRGLTPIQLIVLLAVLLILFGLLVPVIQRIRSAASQAQSENNLRQCALAIHNVHDAFKGMPPVVGQFANKSGSLHFFILPYIEQNQLYNNAQNAVWDNDVWSNRIDVYVDPRDPTAPVGDVYQSWLGTTNYPGNWMVFKDGKGGTTFAQIPDGTSNTLMFAQRYQVCNGAPTAWGYPSLYTWAPMFAYYNQSVPQRLSSASDCDATRPQAIAGVLLTAFCDGSSRNINLQVSAQTWANLCDPADGNVLGNDF